MRNLTPLKTLPAFEAVAKHLNITKAAAELFVTHSAVSQAIKNLEDSLNTTLLKRDKRSMELTPAGEELLTAVKNGLDSIETTVTKLRRQNDPYTITINMQTSFATIWFVPRLNEFMGEHPRYHVIINTPSLNTTAKRVDFDSIRFDCAIYFGYGEWTGLTTELLLTEEIFPICKPNLIAPNMSFTEAFKKYPLIIINTENFRNILHTWCEQKNLPYPDKKRQLLINHPLVALQAAKKGLGILLSNNLLAKEALASKQLIRPFKETLDNPPNYYFVYPSERKHEKKLKLLSTWLKKQTTAKSKKNEA